MEVLLKVKIGRRTLERKPTFGLIKYLKVNGAGDTKCYL
jgi:hypothetical protein